MIKIICERCHKELEEPNDCVDWVRKCNKRYFSLTGQSPEETFESFICSLGTSFRSKEDFKKLYYELPDYFSKD